MKRILVITFVAVLGASAASDSYAQRANAQARPSLGPLHERASRAGGHVTEVLRDDSAAMHGTVRELAGRSPVIVIGTVLGRRAHLAADGARVQTDVALKVQEAVKGTVARGAVIRISVAGGSHRFADGTTARQYQWGYRPVRDHAQYLFFLRETAMRTPLRGDVVYELAQGPQSQFELDFAADSVTPAVGEARHPIAVRYRGHSAQRLLVELHAAAPRGR